MQKTKKFINKNCLFINGGHKLVFNFFKRKQISEQPRLEIIRSQLATAFSRIKDDISEVNSQIVDNQSEVDKLNAWVSYLNNHSAHNKKQHRELSGKLSKLECSHKTLHESHSSAKEELHLKHGTLSKSHNLTKQEVDNLKRWVHHFHTLFNQQKQKELVVSNQLSDLNDLFIKTIEASKSEISTLKQENVDLKSQLSKLQESHSSFQRSFEESSSDTESSEPIVNQVSRGLIAPPQVAVQSDFSGFEKQFIRRIRPNRKQYVLDQILKMVGEQQYTTREIEDVLVSEKQLCGRTSFFSYLKELRITGKIDNATVGGRVILVDKN